MWLACGQSVIPDEDLLRDDLAGWAVLSRAGRSAGKRLAQCRTGRLADAGMCWMECGGSSEFIKVSVQRHLSQVSRQEAGNRSPLGPGIGGASLEYRIEHPVAARCREAAPVGVLASTDRPISVSNLLFTAAIRSQASPTKAPISRRCDSHRCGLMRTNTRRHETPRLSMGHAASKGRQPEAACDRDSVVWGCTEARPQHLVGSDIHPTTRDSASASPLCNPPCGRVHSRPTRPVAV